MLFTHTNKIEIPELADDETDPTENLEDDGTTSTIITQPYLPHSPQEDTSFGLDETLPYHRVENGDNALQSRVGDLLDVLLLGSNYMLFGVYQDWVHQNTGNHMDCRITEGGKWQ